MPRPTQKSKQIYVPVVKDLKSVEKSVSEAEIVVPSGSEIQKAEGKSSATKDVVIDGLKNNVTEDQRKKSAEKMIAPSDKEYTLVTRTSPARKVQALEDVTLSIISKNAFDLIANEVEALSDDGSMELAVYGGSHDRLPQTPYFVGSPRASRKKRKWSSKNSPISGGDIPLITGGSHQN
uniref:Uncharacterized protein n=1 Tax=Noccaea caerulescens TaxID=107243 RepID=A0A1J3H720_NOCCA